MDEERPSGAEPGFLPPDPGGPEPDLGAPPPPPPPPPQAWAPPPPTGWQQPPPPAWQAPPQPWAYQPQPAVPDNGPAVAGFVLSLVGGTLLLLSVGLSSIVSVICAGLGIFYSRRGRARVDRGETPKHRGLAQAGFVVGIVALILSLLATAFWTVFVILYATDESFREDFEDGGGGSDGFETGIRAAAVLARVVWSLAG